MNNEKEILEQALKEWQEHRGKIQEGIRKALQEEENNKKKDFDLDLKGSPFDFSHILQEMQELYNKKNHDYGNSFSETIQEFGFIPAVARINDKFKRVKQMVKGEQMQVNESMRDNLIDIANYCILTIIELDKQKMQKVELSIE